MNDKSRNGRIVRKSRKDTLTTGGAGSAKALMEEGIRQHPNDPAKQLSFLLDRVSLQAFTGRKREVSELTRTRFGQTLKRAIGELRGLNMPIQRIDQIGRRHVVALVAYWVNEGGQTAGTVSTKVSNLRKYCTLIGKQGTVPVGDELEALLQDKGLAPGSLVREQVASESKTWRAMGVDPDELVARVAEKHPHEGLLLETMRVWGLRVSEVLSLRPHQADQGAGLSVTRGTKGGRPRVVPYMKDPKAAARQRDVLDRCQEWVDSTARKDMGYPGKTMKQTRRSFYYVIGQYGITEDEQGITSHGLRHEFAADMFEDLTGHRPPVEGEEPPEWFKANRQLVEDAKQKVTEALGHWRVDITGAYLGSVPKMSRLQKVRIERVVAMVESTPGVASGLLEAGVTRAWLTGRAAHGIEVPARERITLTVQMQASASMAEFGAAKAVLEKLLPGRVTLVPLVNEVEPADGLEVFLDR